MPLSIICVGDSVELLCISSQWGWLRAVKLKLSDSLKYTHNTRKLDPSSSISTVKHERTFATAKGMWRSGAMGGKSLIYQLALPVLNGKAVSLWSVLTGEMAGPMVTHSLQCNNWKKS